MQDPLDCKNIESFDLLEITGAIKRLKLRWEFYYLFAKLTSSLTMKSLLQNYIGFVLGNVAYGSFIATIHGNIFYEASSIAFRHDRITKPS